MRAEAAAPDDSSFAAALRRLLAKGADDPAFTALALTLPGETDLAREMGENVDPDILFKARAGLRRALGEALKPALEQCYALERRRRALFAGRRQRGPARAAQRVARS